MSLEITVAKEIELQGLVEVAESWVQEWNTTRERGLDNTLRLLTNMYDYKKIKLGIDENHVDIFGEALRQLKYALVQDSRLSKYRFLFPALDTTYAELVKYTSQPQEINPAQSNKKTA